MKNFFFICMIFVVNSVSGQKNSSYFPLQSATTLNLILPPLTGNFYQKSVIPGDFYVHQLGFFCKEELKFEAATKIPFKFRLGSVQYCDWMEGKKNAGVVPAY